MTSHKLCVCMSTKGSSIKSPKMKGQTMKRPSTHISYSNEEIRTSRQSALSCSDFLKRLFFNYKNKCNEQMWKKYVKFVKILWYDDFIQKSELIYLTKNTFV